MTNWPPKILESRNPGREGMQRSKAFTSHRAASGLLWFREMLLWCYFSDFSFSLSLSGIFPPWTYTPCILMIQHTNDFWCFWEWDKILIFCLPHPVGSRVVLFVQAFVCLGASMYRHSSSRWKMLKRGRVCAVVNELATHQRLETAARFAARTGASDWERGNLGTAENPRSYFLL